MTEQSSLTRTHTKLNRVFSLWICSLELQTSVGWGWVLRRPLSRGGGGDGDGKLLSEDVDVVVCEERVRDRVLLVGTNDLADGEEESKGGARAEHVLAQCGQGTAGARTGAEDLEAAANKADGETHERAHHCTHLDWLGEARKGTSEHRNS